MSENIFPYLIIGLAKFIDSNYKYPYPRELSYSLNILSNAMLSTYPKTLKGLLDMFSQPLHLWWPATIKFTGFNPEAELIYDGTLGEEATEFLHQFLDETQLPPNTSIKNIQIALDNQLIKNLLTNLQTIHNQDKTGTQHTYTTIRKFLIEHPWTTPIALNDALGDLPHIKVADIGDMYIDAREIAPQLLHHNNKTKATYWNCFHCGPLQVKHQQLTSIKPSVCGKHCPGPHKWQAIPPNHNLRVLRKGIHLRTHIPGILEVEIFNWLIKQKEANPYKLLDVQLWPGIDRYDLQLKFNNEVWAIDVKDYKDPYQLGHKIKNDTLYNYGDLAWDCGFYVFPAYREQQNINYRKYILNQVGKLKPNINIVSDTVFKNHVKNKLTDKDKN